MMAPSGPKQLRDLFVRVDDSSVGGLVYAPGKHLQLARLPIAA